jgi:hypothetical protein
MGRKGGSPEGLRKMGDESVLAAGAGDAMKTSKLPKHRPERMWGGPGSGSSCAICGKTIGTEELEFELQFASEGGSATANYHVHVHCFAAWELERRDAKSNGHSLPYAGDGGIMLSRERNTIAQEGRG